MNEELIASEIKKEILVKNFIRYFEILDKADQKPFNNNNWRKAQLLYNSIDQQNKENLKDFVKMIITESVTDILAYVDGIATFKDQKYPFGLYYNGIKVSGSIQEYLLMDIEENGFITD